MKTLLQAYLINSICWEYKCSTAIENPTLKNIMECFNEKYFEFALRWALLESGMTLDLFLDDCMIAIKTNTEEN